MASLFQKLKERKDAMDQGDATGYAGDKGFDNGQNHQAVSEALRGANAQVERNVANGKKAEQEKEKNQRRPSKKNSKKKGK